MLPNKSDTVQVLNNIDADLTGQFTVDENSLAKIMSVLTNLYSDPEGAVVREYLTNALDAQIEAQEADSNYVWRPIEVTTPSMFSKEYKVRDFGPGMNADDLKDIYSKYGKSTKESSQTVTGMLGLGSKCALTYTGQFTITGYKNGIRTRAVVSKDDNDIPIFMIVDTRATTEPNGVEISVPVRDRNSFATKTSEFLRWWKDGQVLVDGAEPVKHGLALVKTDKMHYKVGDRKFSGKLEVYLREKERTTFRYEAPQSVVVMGNVPYSVDAEYVDENLRNAGLGFVAYVPMGVVDFPPSREKLFYNNRTKGAVTEISKGLFESILKKKLDDVVNAADHKTAWTNFQNLDTIFRNHPNAKNLKYKGLEFTERFQHDHMILDWNWQGHGEIAERQFGSVGQGMHGVLVVHGVKQDSKPNSYFKKKVRYYMQENNIDYATAWLVDDDIDNGWLANLPRIDAETVRALKLPKDGTGTARTEAPYEWYQTDAKGSYETSGSDVTLQIPKGHTVVYISPQDMKETYSKRGIGASTFAEICGPNIFLVVTGKNRFEKFVRNHPNAVEGKVAIKNRIAALVANATDAEFIYSQLEYGEKEFLSQVAPKQIDDPELRKVAEYVQSNNRTENYSKAENVSTMARRASIYADVPARKNVSSLKVTKRYPLIENSGSRHMKHMLVYVNAVYAAEYAPKP
jgi:hypothetical protein